MSEQSDSQTVTTAGDIIASRYEFIEKLGEGGMGSVFKAHDKLLKRSVAVKILNVSSVSQDDIVRFHREAKAASNIVHPNVIKVLDFGVTESGQPYMVMEFVNGKNLHDLIKTKGALPIQLSLELVEQICNGMIAVHRVGIVHRDLKAGNILVIEPDNASPEVKILDFGIAKAFKSSQESTLTQTGHILGSPRYMSPEQARGETLDERSDIYSLGCITFEMLTGEPLFTAPTALETMALHTSAKPPKLADKRSYPFPEQVEELVAHAVAKKPDERFASMIDLKKAVGESLSAVEKLNLPPPIKQQETVPTPKKRIPPKVVAAGITLVLAGIAITSFVCYKISHQEKMAAAQEDKDGIVLEPQKVINIRETKDLDFSKAEQSRGKTKSKTAEVATKPRPFFPGRDPLSSQIFTEKKSNGTLSALISGLSGDTNEFQEGKLSLLAAPQAAGTTGLVASMDQTHLNQIERLCSRHASIENIFLHKLEIKPERLGKALTLNPVQVAICSCNLNDDHLKVISKNNTIEILILEKNQDITEKGLRTLSRMPALKILFLSGCAIDRKKMEAVATLPKVTAIFLNDNPKVSPKDLELILAHKSLNYVNVRNTAASYLPKTLKAMETKYKKCISTDPPQFNTESFIETMSFATHKIR